MIHSSSQTYVTPTFLDSQRLSNIKATFPKLDLLYQQYANKHLFPGYAYGIMVDGKLAHSGSGGMADIEKKIPASPQSVFHIASMTKSFTAMAILSLRETGLLQLDHLLSQYVPEITQSSLLDDTPRITIRDLLLHVAGFSTDDPWADRKLDETNHELIELLKKGLYFSRATREAFEYSNLGYTLLALVIERVTNTPYDQYINETICHPIGMKAYWDFGDVPSGELVQGYRRIEGQWQKEKLLHKGIYGAMGGMLSSIESFSHYVALHQNAWPARQEEENGLLPRQVIREMHQPWIFRELIPHFKFSEGFETIATRGYGYGLVWMRDAYGRTFVGHAGGLPGFGTHWCFMPEYGVGVILLTNGGYAPAWDINFDILNQLVVQAKLKPRELPASDCLQVSQKALSKILPNWEESHFGDIFADNFFLDLPVEFRRKQTLELFYQIGKPVSIGNVIAESQLKGYFIINGEQKNLRVQMAMNPENPPKIHELKLEVI